MLESASSSTHNLGFDEKATKKLIRKIDLVLLPFLALLYLLSFLDRTNIGNARLANLEEDLGMSGLDYNVSISASACYTVGRLLSHRSLSQFSSPSTSRLNPCPT